MHDEFQPGLLDGFVMDKLDENLTKVLGIPALITDTIMLEPDQ